MINALLHPVPWRLIQFPAYRWEQIRACAIRLFRVLIPCLVLTTVANAAGLPYDEKADAKADLAHALIQARTQGKQVLVVFGANWCPECRTLDKRMHDESGTLGLDQFVIVKIDVGRFDRNIELAQSLGNPIRKGIPAAALLTPERHVVYAGLLSHFLNPYERLVRVAAFAAALAAVIFASLWLFFFLRRRIQTTHAARG